MRVFLFIAVLMLVSGRAGAQATAEVAPLIVGNDRGGLLTDRIVQVQALRSSGRPVRIEGAICYSTCTMLIGLPQVCVNPTTEFGFHGPSSFGRPLAPDRFEYASQIIASHYPETLRTWYLREARRTIWGLHRVSGAELIRLGVDAC